MVLGTCPAWGAEPGFWADWGVFFGVFARFLDEEPKFAFK